MVEKINTIEARIDEQSDEKKYFTYVNERNTYHTAHVLMKIVEKNSEHIKYVCLVVASVEPDIAEQLLLQLPKQLKAKIVKELMSLIQFSKKEIEKFDKILRKLLTEQFGGKFVLSKILENLDIDQKVSLTMVMGQNYPAATQKFRKLMILFEDLFNVSDKDFARIFTEIDPEMLSVAFCQLTETEINRLYQVLPKGVKSIVQQGIDLGRNKKSRTEINQSQQYIIEYSKKLEEDGFIDTILKEENSNRNSNNNGVEEDLELF